MSPPEKSGRIPKQELRRQKGSKNENRETKRKNMVTEAARRQHKRKTRRETVIA